MVPKGFTCQYISFKYFTAFCGDKILCNIILYHNDDQTVSKKKNKLSFQREDQIFNKNTMVTFYKTVRIPESPYLLTCDGSLPRVCVMKMYFKERRSTYVNLDLDPN